VVVEWAWCGQACGEEGWPLCATIPTTYARTSKDCIYNFRNTKLHDYKHVCTGTGQIFRIGTVRYAEGLRRMRRHGPVIAHCTDSEDFPRYSYKYEHPGTTLPKPNLTLSR